MFYRIKEKEVSDYADYKYANDCLFTDICTMEQFDKYKNNYTCENGVLQLIANIEELLVNRRQEQFEREFFHTSLGNIRRKVCMKDGSTKDFLSDLLAAIKAGIELGQTVEIITYKTPDFTKELTSEYMKSLQEIKTATTDFIQECLHQTVQDFGLNNGGNNGI